MADGGIAGEVMDKGEERESVCVCVDGKEWEREERAENGRVNNFDETNVKSEIHEYRQIRVKHSFKRSGKVAGSSHL
jgi:hypothetical protein